MTLHPDGPHAWRFAGGTPEDAEVCLFGLAPSVPGAELEALARLARNVGPRARILAFPNLGAGRTVPRGCVLATPDLVVPAAAGADPGCGVRVLAVRGVRPKKAREHRGELARALADAIPRETGALALRAHELDAVLRDGAAWAVARKLGEEPDLLRLEGGGRVAEADPRQISAEARVRAAPQLGTLGSGAHFLELAVVEEPVDGSAAALGFEPGALAVVIHTGSRALGHQVQLDFEARFARLRPQQELATAPLASDEGRAFLGAARAAENFALANRQVATQRVREVLRAAFGGLAIDVAFDASHARLGLEPDARNPAGVALHRNGAVRALAPGHSELPAPHRALGTPFLLPGGLGHPSLLCAATGEPARRTLGSLPHGVGRALTPAEARERSLGRELVRELARTGLALRSAGRTRLEEELPDAWRPLEALRAWLETTGLARPLARLTPFVLVRG